LNATGAQTLSYIGHSQGTIQAFAGFSLPQNAEIASRVNLFVAMAPVAYVHQQRGLLLKVIADMKLDKIIRWFGFKEFLPSAGILPKLAPVACRTLPNGCDSLLDIIVGPSNHLNRSRIEVYVSETPAGTSVRNMVHWGQGIRGEKEGFRMYDWGSKEQNIAAYGYPEPPKYNLSAINVPIVLASGGHDYLADPADVDKLENELAPGVLRKRIHLETFAHLDFSWAYDAHELLYPQILSLLKEASQAPAPAPAVPAPAPAVPVLSMQL